MSRSVRPPDRKIAVTLTDGETHLLSANSFHVSGDSLEIVDCVSPGYLAMFASIPPRFETTRVFAPGTWREASYAESPR